MVVNPAIFLVSELLSENITCCASLCVFFFTLIQAICHIKFNAHMLQGNYTGSSVDLKPKLVLTWCSFVQHSHDVTTITANIAVTYTLFLSLCFKNW